MAIKKGSLQVERWHSYEQIVTFFSSALNGKIKDLDFVGFDTLSIANEEFVRPETEVRLSAKTKVAMKSVIPTWDDRKPAAEMIYNLLRWGSDCAGPDNANPMHIIYTAHELTREDKSTGSFVRGPALPGRFIERGPGLVQECYHLISTSNEEDATKPLFWYVTKGDGTWPAKGSESLEMYEEPDLWNIIQKVQKIDKQKIGRTFLLYGATGTGKTRAFQSLLKQGLRGKIFDADGQASARLSMYL